MVAPTPKPPKQSDGAFFVDRYGKDPVRFVREVLGAEPDTWQTEALTALVENPRVAVASGHGVGKTALTSWIILWFISTRPNPQIVVTANTKNQLDSKTWRELAKWHRQARNKDWFEWTATRFFLKAEPETWFASAIPWTEHNSEAFAGTHERHVLILFDEASAIADRIWEVIEGAMTTEGARWAAFGNPTRNSGRFRECWGKFKHRWKTFQVDSRTAKMADQRQITAWIEDYGEDSDFVRVRVRGLFPRAGSNQFIPSDVVDACKKYKAEGYDGLAKVFGVDVARFGDDQNVVCIRQGRRVIALEKWRGIDTMQTASKVMELIEEHDPDLVFVDGVGVGGGVVDRLVQLAGRSKICEVNAGSAADDWGTYFNKRAEMWGRTRDALKAGVELPDDNELSDELSAPEYGFDPKNRIQIEKKEDMKKRGLSSPDCADALALTYAQNVIKNRAKPVRPPDFSFANQSEAGWMGA